MAISAVITRQNTVEFFNVCAGCHAEFPHHEDGAGENRRQYGSEVYCEPCYFGKLSSAIIGSAARESVNLG